MLTSRAPIKQKTTLSSVAEAIFRSNVKGNLTIAHSLMLEHAQRGEIPPGYAFNETVPDTLFELILSNSDARYFDGIVNFLGTRLQKGVCDLHAYAIGDALVKYAATSQAKFVNPQKQAQILARMLALAKFKNPDAWRAVFTYNRADNSIATLLIGKPIVQGELLLTLKHVVADKVSVDSLGVILQNRYRCTWLFCAAAVNQVALVEALLEAGANPSIKLGDLNPGEIDDPEVAELDAMKVALAKKATESAQMIGAMQAKSSINSVLAKFGLGPFGRKVTEEET